MTLTQGFIDKFLSSLSEKGHPKNTVRAYKSDVMMFLTWTERTPEELNALNQEDLERLMAQYINLHRQTWKPKTTTRKLTALRAWGKHLGYHGVLEGYVAPTPARAQPHPIEEGVSAVRRMIQVASTAEHRALVALCGLAGLRVSETRSVLMGDINLKDRMLYVRGKGSRDRLVPLSHAAWEALTDVFNEILIANAPAMEQGGFDAVKDIPLVMLSDRRAREVITLVAKRAGVKHRVSSHDLRATFATAAYDKTKNLRAVQDLLGHSSSKTTEVYTGISQQRMREAVELDEED